MPIQEITPVQDATDVACDNPRNLLNCLGWAVSIVDGSKYCQFCRTYEILTAAGLDPEVIA